MNSKKNIYTKEELKILKEIDNGDFDLMSKNQFLKEKKKLEKITKKTLERLKS